MQTVLVVDDDPSFLEALSLILQDEGFRVVAVAFKEIAEPRRGYDVPDEAGQTLLGYIAFLDPPKETAAAAIATLNRSGVAVKILTGDNEVITRTICHQVGLPVGRVLLGSEIEAMSDETFGVAVHEGQRHRQGLADAEGAGDRCTAPARPRGGLPWRRHQRRPGAEGRRCRSIQRWILSRSPPTSSCWRKALPC